MVFLTNIMPLTNSERTELMTRAKIRTGRTEDARRARVILRLAEGRTWDAICDQVGCRRGFVAMWRQRFTDERLALGGIGDGDALRGPRSGRRGLSVAS